MRPTAVVLMLISCLCFGADPRWYPAWQAPGVIKAIPNSTLEAAIAANGWTAADPVAGGTGWPRGLWAYSGACVGYIQGQPYVMLSGGGHATHADNSIYAFGPLYGTGSDTPQWSRVSTQTKESDIRTCSDLYADNRPSSRHTVGDFTYHPAGYVVMMWVNSWYCSNGGTHAGCPVDVFDVTAGEWETAKNPRVTRACNTLRPRTHSCSGYHGYDGYIYAMGREFGRYDVISDVFTKIPLSGAGGIAYDGRLITLGPRNFVYGHKNSGDNAVRINTQTGVSELWAYPIPNGSGSASDHDALQDRVYMCKPGITTAGADNMPDGTKEVAWIDAGATSSPSWTIETFHGDTPHQTGQWSGWGHFSYVKELRGFAYSPAYDSPVFIYRTSGATAVSSAPVNRSAVAVHVCPNPLNSRTSIRVNGIRNAAARIYNLNGKRVTNLSASTPNSFIWNASNFPAGIYLLRVCAGKYLLQKKLCLFK